MSPKQLVNDGCWTKARIARGDGTRRFVNATDGVARYKPKARVFSPGQAARMRGNSKLEAYRCTACGYVHLGSPKQVAA